MTSKLLKEYGKRKTPKTKRIIRNKTRQNKKPKEKEIANSRVLIIVSFLFCFSYYFSDGS